MQDEILDIVNEHDQVIGTVNRADAASDKVYLRIVLAFLIDQYGRIGLLKRTAHKILDPLAWALVGGCVASGENYDTAIVREVAEEVNLHPADYRISLLGYYPPHQGWLNRHGVGYYKKVYLLELKQNEIVYNPDDFCEIAWKTHNEFIADQNNMHFAKGVIWLLQQLPTDYKNNYFSE